MDTRTDELDKPVQRIVDTLHPLKIILLGSGGTLPSPSHPPQGAFRA